MFKFKKILSAVLAVSMLGANVVSIASANETYAYTEASNAYAFAWTTDYRYVDNVSIKDTENVFGCVTDAAAHTGTHSYLIRHADSSKNWSAIYLKQATDIPAGTYTVSLWTNGGVNGIFNAVQFPGENRLSTFEVAESDGDWRKYTKTITVDSTVSTFMITCNGEAPGIYIDDISVKDADGKEYIDNGSFDENGRVEPEKTDMYEDFKYGWNEQNNVQEDVDTFGCVTDVKTHGGDHAYLLHHGGNAWSAFFLRQSVDMPAGTYKASFWVYGIGGWGGSSTPGTFDWDNGQYNGIRVSGNDELKFKDMSKRTVGAWTEYTAEFSLDGAATSFELICNGYTTAMIIDDISITDASGKEYIANGGFEEQDEEEPPVVVPEATHTYTEEFDGYAYSWSTEYAAQNGSSIKDESERFGCVTDAQAHSGKHSYLLRHTGYSNDEAGGWAWSAIFLKQAVGIPAGTYTLSFAIKGKGGVYTAGQPDDFDWEINQFDCVNLGGDIKIRYDQFTVSETDENGWSTWTKEVTLDKDCKQFTLFTNGHTRALYIDDFSVKDADGNEYISNGGFEEDGKFTFGKTDKYADYFENGWTYTNNVTEDTTADGTYGCVTDVKAHGGERAFLLHHDGKPWTAYYLRQNVNMPADTYTLSFYVYGIGGIGGSSALGTYNYDNSQYNRIVFTGDGVPSVEKYFNNADFKTIKMGDWTKYIMTVELDGKYTQFNLVCNGYTNVLIIDDISITDATGKEYVKNGGFEQKLDKDSCVNPVLYATSEGNTLNLSWTNPAKAYDEIKIYFDGELQTGLAVEDISTAANAFNEFYVSGLQNYTDHTAKIECVRDGKVIYTMELSAKPDDLGLSMNYAGNSKLGAWTFSRSEDSTYGYANTVASIDYEEKSTGSSSLKLTGNIPKETRNVYPNVGQTVTLDRGKMYVLSFDAKLDNVGLLSTYYSASIDDESIFEAVKPVTSYTTSDWNNYKIPLVFETAGGSSTFDEMEEGATYALNIRIGVEAILGSAWIDNVRVYEVDQSDSTYAPIDENENLISNGDFEFAKYTVEKTRFELVDGANLTEIKNIQEGKIKVTSAVRNVKMGDAFNVKAAIAVYNGKKLVDVPYSMERILPESAVCLPTDSFSTTVTIPEIKTGDNYQIKVFYWQGAELSPLAEADCLK